MIDNTSKQPDNKTIELIPIETILKTFGNRVKEERNKKRITQAQLAEYINVSDDTIKRLERGNGVKLDVAYHVATVLEIPIQSLLPPQNMQSEHKLIERFYDARDTLEIILAEYEEKIQKND